MERVSVPTNNQWYGSLCSTFQKATLAGCVLKYSRYCPELRQLQPQRASLVFMRVLSGRATQSGSMRFHTQKPGLILQRCQGLFFKLAHPLPTERQLLRDFAISIFRRHVDPIAHFKNQLFPRR